MKLIVFAFVALVATASASTLDVVIEREGPASGSFAAFQGFMAEFDRVYDTPSIMAERFAIFQENMREAAEMNVRQPTAEYGVTRFSDMTFEEFEAEWLSSVPDMSNMPSSTFKAKTAPKAKSVFSAPPNSVDWRPQINPIKDQKSCGSCWAFSAMAAVEGALVAAGEPLVDGAEQALVDCDVRSQGCNGGWMHWGALQAVADGVKSTEDYPYQARDGECQADSTETIATVSDVVIRCANHEWVPPEDRTDYSCPEDESREAVAGRVQSIGINASMMMNYRAGIMDTDDIECPVIMNHGVNLVGYDSEDGVDYWIIRNSWGSRWGEDGYIRVITGKNACGIQNYQIEVTV